MARSGEPPEHGAGGRDAAWLAGRHAELDEGDQPPVRAAPFAVWVDAEAAVLLLSGEQRANLPALEHLRHLTWTNLAEQITLRSEPDARLVARKQPLDGGFHRQAPWSSGASRSSRTPSRQTPSGSRQYSRIKPTRRKPIFS